MTFNPISLNFDGLPTLFPYEKTRQKCYTANFDEIFC